MDTGNEPSLLTSREPRLSKAAKPMLAGLGAGPEARARRRRVVSALALLAALFVGGAGVMLSRGVAVLPDKSGGLPAIPLAKLESRFTETAVDFVVDTALLHWAHSVGPARHEILPGTMPSSRRRKRTVTPALDVAILSVLVEHIDAERRQHLRDK